MNLNQTRKAQYSRDTNRRMEDEVDPDEEGNTSMGRMMEIDKATKIWSSRCWTIGSSIRRGDEEDRAQAI